MIFRAAHHECSSISLIFSIRIHTLPLFIANLVSSSDTLHTFLSTIEVTHLNEMIT